MLLLIAAHAVLGVFAPLLIRYLRARAFWVLTVAPLVSGIWLLTVAPTILAGHVIVERYRWIDPLGVHITLRLGLLQWVLAMIVTWVGALVLAYCRWYFEDHPPPASAAVLTAFAGTMLGLVTADDLVVVYVFWELTTVFSYLVIGHDPTRRANRGAALTALIVTTTGGLAMLIGIVALGSEAGTFSLSAILTSPPHGTVVTVAALLILVGALSKSALVPFHFWLPGAMAAPTPISAYLHAAAMVKAGVYLIAAFAPVFSGVLGWRPAVLILGAATMILGGWRSLRQTDLKLLLAYGTVSQLGFMVLLVGIGTKTAALAGLGLVIAHALFKSTLFLCTGIVDHGAGTRDLRELSGVGRRHPWLAGIALLGAASMAGLPPLLGFVTKESSFEALMNLVGEDGAGVTPLAGSLVVVAVVLGSALTVAYSLRWWWGAFATKAGVDPSPWRRPALGIVAIPSLLGVAGIVLGFAGGPLTNVLAPYAETLPAGKAGHGLALWQGLGWPLAMSAVAILAGAFLFTRRDQAARIQATFPPTPTAESYYHRSMRTVDRLAVEMTARTQRGSLSVYLGTILVALVAVVGYALIRVRDWPGVRIWDQPAQLGVGIVMVAGGLAAAFSRGRVRAVLLTGVTGYGVALLFALHGAPDLALTQVLVETVTLVVFVLVIRKLPRYFTNRPLSSTRWWRLLVAVSAGLTATLVFVVTAGHRIAPPVSEAWYEAAYQFGYGKNIVNVALVDTRAWDTLGEISVLVIAATGVASLIFVRSRESVVTRTADALRDTSQSLQADSSPGVWLRGGQTLSPSVRSLVFEVIARLLFGVMIVVSIYLLLAGHNRPGGGFAGGLVAGMALVIRYLAAGRHELDEAAPFDAGRLLGAGMFVALTSAIAPVLGGGKVLQSYDWHLDLPGPDVWSTPWGAQWPLFGDVHLVSSTAFDIGVYLIVVGVLLDLARSLGAGIDIHAADQRAPVPKPGSTRAIPARTRRPGGAT